jgi:hypothetical protein
MGYIKAADVPDDIPAGVPLIGYVNFITGAGALSSTTAAAGFPISNATNPATHLKWRGGVNTGDEFVDSARLEVALNYIGIAGHNFGSSATLVAVEGQDPAYSLLHFDGADASTSIVESQSLGGVKTWTAAGNAQLDTAQYKFGGSSLLLDGTGDWVSTLDMSDFALFNSGFTFDCWIRPTSLAVPSGVFGQVTDANNIARMFISTNGALNFDIRVNSVVFTLTSAPGAIVVNQWQHVAVVRNGITLYLFVDGILVATGSEPRTIPLLVQMFVGQDGFGQLFTGWIDEWRYVRFIARWTANFTPPKKPSGFTTLVNVSTDDSQILLHFDGAQNSTSISDSNSLGTDHTWTAAGNAKLDQGNIKFGTASLLCDGTGDWVTTPASPDFDVGAQDFTLDCWFNVNGGAGTFRWLGGQGNGLSNRSVLLFLITSGQVRGSVFKGGVEFAVTGTTAFTTQGWHHAALVRAGDILRLFIDGIQEGGNVSFTGSADSSTTVFGVGVEGSAGSNGWNGWIDEFRLSIGTARWTANFTPPTSPGAAGSFITNDKPLLFRWNPIPTIRIRLHLRPDSAPPEMAVFYLGYLTVLERSITIGRDHVPITYGRKTTVINGMSETGNFLGRIVLGEYRESKAEFEWFKPDFYRATLDAFLDSAQETPFFWVWNPTEYPDEVGYVWLTNDPQPQTDPVTRRVGLTLEMRGIA